MPGDRVTRVLLLNNSRVDTNGDTTILRDIDLQQHIRMLRGVNVGAIAIGPILNSILSSHRSIN